MQRGQRRPDNIGLLAHLPPAVVEQVLIDLADGVLDWVDTWPAQHLVDDIEPEVFSPIRAFEVLAARDGNPLLTPPNSGAFHLDVPNLPEGRLASDVVARVVVLHL